MQRGRGSVQAVASEGRDGQACPGEAEVSAFQIWLLVGLGAIVFGLFYIGACIVDLRRDVSEIWKRMERLD